MKIPCIMAVETEDLVKPIELTHELTSSGWHTYLPQKFNKLIYVGKCKEDGDMFIMHLNNGLIVTCKGNLNGGYYEG